MKATCTVRTWGAQRLSLSELAPLAEAHALAGLASQTPETIRSMVNALRRAHAPAAMLAPYEQEALRRLKGSV